MIFRILTLILVDKSRSRWLASHIHAPSSTRFRLCIWNLWLGLLGRHGRRSRSLGICDGAIRGEALLGHIPRHLPRLAASILARPTVCCFCCRRCLSGLLLGPHVPWCCHGDGQTVAEAHSRQRHWVRHGHGWYRRNGVSLYHWRYCIAQKRFSLTAHYSGAYRRCIWGLAKLSPNKEARLRWIESCLSSCYYCYYCT